MTTTSVLYTFNTQTKQVSQVNIPFIVNGNNGQPLRSLEYAGEGVLAGAYGNVLGFLNVTTGQMFKKITVWPLTVGCNATKYAGSDLDNDNIYVECIGKYRALVRAAPFCFEKVLTGFSQPTQWIHTVNVVTGKVTPGAPMPANRGIADIVGSIGGWNATWIITVNANILGPNIGLLNPATGEWGQTFDTYGTFVAHKMTFAGAGRAVWDKKNQLYYLVSSGRLVFCSRKI